MREQRLQTISQLIGSRFGWSAAMNELSRVLPPRSRSARCRGRSAPRRRAPRRPQARPRPRRALRRSRLPPRPQRLLARGVRRHRGPCDLRHASRHDAHLHARRVRDQPDRGRADACAPTFDQRRQQRHPAELCPVWRRRWLGRLRWHMPGRRPLLFRAGELPAAADAAEPRASETLEASAPERSPAGGSSSKSGSTAVSTSDKGKGAAG